MSICKIRFNNEQLSHLLNCGRSHNKPFFCLHQDSTTCKYKTCQRLNKQIIFSANSYLKQHMRVHTLRTRRKLFIANIVVNLSFLRVTLMSIFEATPERKVLLQCIHSAFGDGDGFITLNSPPDIPCLPPPPPCPLSAARPGKNIV